MGQGMEGETNTEEAREGNDSPQMGAGGRGKGRYVTGAP